MSLFPIWSPADFAETLAKAQDHQPRRRYRGEHRQNGFRATVDELAQVIALDNRRPK